MYNNKFNIRLAAKPWIFGHVVPWKAFNIFCFTKQLTPCWLPCQRNKKSLQKQSYMSYRLLWSLLYTDTDIATMTQHYITIPSPQSLVLCRHKFSFCFQLGKTPSLELQPRWPVWDSSCKLNKKATNIPCNWTPDNDNDKDNRHHIKVKTALSLFWSTDSLPRK